MTTSITLTSEEEKWLSDWSTLSGYKTNEEGIREVLKTIGAIPKGSDFYRQRFGFAEG